MNQFFRLKYFLNYQWRAKTKYYLHSPFVYQFYLNVLEGHDDENLKSIRALRKELSTNHATVSVTDFGTGPNSALTISVLADIVAVRPKYGRLLYRLVKYFNPENILELGTSIGLSSAYMALANKHTAITSLEGSPSLIEVAKDNHAALGIQNTHIYQGNFDELLPVILQNKSSLGLVFFDGNHRKQATLNYFTQCLEKATPDSIFIFDDIHWSEEMHEAWTEIKAHPQITLTLDVFQFGICFFKKEKLAKEEFILRY
jgi:predicted O-methyltransferase YrrM